MYLFASPLSRAMFGNHAVPIINGHTHFRQSQRGPQQFTHPVGGPIYGPTLVQPSVPAYALHSPLVGVDSAAAVGAYNVPQQRASHDFPPAQISDAIELAEMKRFVSQRDHVSLYFRLIFNYFSFKFYFFSYFNFKSSAFLLQTFHSFSLPIKTILQYV